MKKLQTVITLATLFGALAAPAFAQNSFNPNGTFVDKYGTTFTFALCGSGTDLCGTLDVLKGQSATTANLAYVGKQVLQIKQSGPNTWKGDLAAGGMSAKATVTQTSANSINIQGCRAVILCQTLTYTRK
jgi:hypothetical protein